MWSLSLCGGDCGGLDSSVLHCSCVWLITSVSRVEGKWSCPVTTGFFCCDTCAYGWSIIEYIVFHMAETAVAEEIVEV